MLVYRGMDIGTAKPTPAERSAFRYRGIDLVSPAEPCSAGLYLEAARAALHDAADSDCGLLVVGGTGLYIDLLLHGLSGDGAPPVPADLRARYAALLAEGGPAALRAEAERLRPGVLARLADPENPRRVQRVLERLALGQDPVPTRETTGPGLLSPDTPCAVLSIPAAPLAERIARRVDAMFAQGLLNEVRALRQAHPVWSSTASAAIGYAEAAAVLDGALSPDEARERIALRTRQLAKRQRTWFRGRLPDAPRIAAPADEADVPRAADDLERLWQVPHSGT